MKSIFALVFVLISFTSYSQTTAKTTSSTKEKKAVIKYNKDIMTDKEYLIYDDNLVCSNDDKKGFVIRPGLKFNKDRKIVYDGLIVRSTGIGNCTENDQLIFLFEDGTKHKMTSWNDFNCKGNSWFDLYRRDFSDINSKRIKAIMFQNGRSYESFTYTLKPEEQDFFIKYNQAINSQQYITVDSLD